MENFLMLPYWYLISRLRRYNISLGFIFAISISNYEKIEGMSIEFRDSSVLKFIKYFSKSVND